MGLLEAVEEALANIPNMEELLVPGTVVVPRHRKSRPSKTTRRHTPMIPQFNMDALTNMGVQPVVVEDERAKDDGSLRCEDDQERESHVFATTTRELDDMIQSMLLDTDELTAGRAMIPPDVNSIMEECSERIGYLRHYLRTYKLNQLHHVANARKIQRSFRAYRDRDSPFVQACHARIDVLRQILQSHKVDALREAAMARKIQRFAILRSCPRQMEEADAGAPSDDVSSNPMR
ncbi:Aste57867_12446 [Aphanomyces stellatus]|uniref:Aste57867_12446 protein n=1 Tax=Aphanomyces stellatus TaxID=120398 RepID=A0A485KVM7_9STRA|nr:hypothetical protein As57867_012400 [Aphanomyces stellatus]VFT89297.1 Aste57867_12446 [Aphanomyces stellatus]